MKVYTEQEYKSKAEAYCSSAEHCTSEVKQKLKLWGASEEQVHAIVAFLTHERFIDDMRYSRAFVRDKYRFAKWGRMKIVQSLKQKNISSECIAQALSAIDEDEYKQGLKDLLRQKRKSVSGKNQYERNAKLIRFAVGKGFLIEEVLCFVKQEDWNEYMD